MFSNVACNGWGWVWHEEFCTSRRRDNTVTIEDMHWIRHIKWKLNQNIARCYHLFKMFSWSNKPTPLLSLPIYLHIFPSFKTFASVPRQSFKIYEDVYLYRVILLSTIALISLIFQAVSSSAISIWPLLYLAMHYQNNWSTVPRHPFLDNI